MFLNARNKQTVWEIVRPLRDLGIPVATIVDVDIYKEGGTVWTHFLEGGNVPEISRVGLAQERSLLKTAFEATGKNPKRDGGVDVLGNGEKESANNLFDTLDDYGLFVVRGGELESWLSGLGVAGKAPKWLVEVFDKMGDDPDAAGYMNPGAGDIWDFIGKVGKWLQNPQRKGA